VVKLDSVFSQIEDLRIKTIEQRKGVSLLALSSIQNLLADPSVDRITVTLDQISENLDNQRIPITRDVRIGGTYPYYGASGIIDYVEKYIFEGNALLVSEDGANLLARSTPIAFSVSGQYWVNNHAHVLKFQDPHLQRYVEYVLEHTKLDPYITGAAQPKLTQRALNTIPIRIPKKREDLLVVTEKITNLIHLSALSLAKLDAKLDLIYELKLSILGENFELEAS
jgi:type I restriction enzyme S subunit